MNVSKTLTSTIAAAALVGAFGLVYAQSGTTTPTPADSTSPAMQNQGTMGQGSTDQGAMNQGAMNQGAMNQGTMNRSGMQHPSTTDASGMVTERPARADRN